MTNDLKEEEIEQMRKGKKSAEDETSDLAE